MVGMSRKVEGSVATNLIQIPASTLRKAFRSIITGSGHFKPVASMVSATNGVGDFGLDILASLWNPVTNDKAF
jgi:hypothetical protein